MSQRLLIRNARQVVTLRGPSSPRRGAEMRELGLLEDGALLAIGGVIREVGPSRRIANLAEAKGAEEIDASGGIVLPGFVDAETDLLEVARRDSRSFSLSRIELEARARLEWFLRHGTTTFAARATDAGGLRVLAALDGKPLDCAATVVCSDANLLDEPQRNARLAMPAVASEAEKFILLARQRGYSTRAPGGSPLAATVRAGCTAIIQPEKLTPAEIALLGDSPVVAVFTPCSAFARHSAYGPARAIIDAGGSVALGTGFAPGASVAVSMPTVMAMARLRMNLTAPETLVAATINAAHACGLARLVGTLEPGKLCDVVIAAVSDPRELSAYLGANLIRCVIKRGRLAALTSSLS